MPHEYFIRRFHRQLDREVIFKLTFANESLHESTNGNAIGIVNSITFKSITVEITMFQRHNIQQITAISPDANKTKCYARVMA
jgi:hypothetical protein